MRAVRVVLIGGTSNAGKSSVARVVAERLGFECRSTDRLARHPGRPWRTPDREVPPHVREHYGTLTTDELIDSVLAHYDRLWPRIQELVTAHATGADGAPGLVLEGSALWPVPVAGLQVPHTGAVWLSAEASVLRARIRTAGAYDEAADAERQLMDSFLARTERYQRLMRDAVARLGLDTVDSGDGRGVPAVADAVLAAVTAQHTVGRSAAGQEGNPPGRGPHPQPGG